MKAFTRGRVVLTASVLFLLTAFSMFGYHIHTGLSKSTARSGLSKQQKVTLHFIHWSEFPRQIFSDFTKKNPNIQVEFERFGMNQYQQVQMARIASGENIDIMGIVENDYEKFTGKGYLMDLTNEEFIKNYEPDVVDALSKLDLENRIYGVSYKREVFGVWYNKILLNKYYLKAPVNFSDFINVCSILKTNGVNPLVMGYKDESASSLIYFLRLYRDLSKDKEWLKGIKNGELDWKNIKAESSLKDIESFLKSGYLLNDSANITQQQAFNKFVSGQAAMCLMSDWSLDMIDPGVDKVCDLGVFPIPYNDKDKPQLVPGTRTGLLFGVFTGSRYKEEAKLLMDYLSQRDTAQNYSEITKSKTTVKGVSYDKLKYNELWEPLRKSELVAPLNSAAGNEVQQAINRSAREFLLGQRKAEEIAGEFQRIWEEENLRKAKTSKKN